MTNCSADTGAGLAKTDWNVIVMRRFVWSLNGIREVYLDLPGHGQVAVSISCDDTLTFLLADGRPEVLCQQVTLGKLRRYPAMNIYEGKPSSKAAPGPASFSMGAGDYAIESAIRAPGELRGQSSLLVPAGTRIRVSNSRTKWIATRDTLEMLRK